MAIRGAGFERGIRWAAATDTGRVRRENQDAWLVRPLPAGLLLAVADGMGGHPNGAWASRYTLERLAEELAARLRVEPADLADAARAVNLAVQREAARIGTPGAGTTLVAALLSGSTCAWLNVGDSRLYALGSRGLQQVTRDHNMAAEPDGHPGLANVLTRCIGIREDLDPDTGVCDPVDGLLLATDGLYSLVERDKLEGALAEDDLARAAARLVDRANRAGGHDNITVLLARPSATG
jgi:protein phosphatase